MLNFAIQKSNIKKFLISVLLTSLSQNSTKAEHSNSQVTPPVF